MKSLLAVVLLRILKIYLQNLAGSVLGSGTLSVTLEVLTTTRNIRRKNTLIKLRAAEYCAIILLIKIAST